MPLRYQFAAFQFDPVSGLLVADAASGVNPVRLQPQPARLLTLLLERAPEIVTREEIRAELWPDVQVDFDRNLHFCIRQIRSALGESAAAPHFIETIPRRGYQWLTDVATMTVLPREDESNSHSAAQIFATASSMRLRAAAIFAVIALACGLAYFPGTPATHGSTPTDVRTSAPSTDNHKPRPLRIAVLSFESDDVSSGNLVSNGIAEFLVDELTNRRDIVFEVVGPTTTEQYAQHPAPLSQLTSDYDIDVLLNGRIIPSEAGAKLLGEVIRGTDGAHVWTRMFTAAELRQEDIEAIVCRELLSGLDDALPLIAPISE